MLAKLQMSFARMRAVVYVFAAALSALVVPDPRGVEDGVAGGERSEILDALDAWTRMRAYPSAELPSAAYANAARQIAAFKRTAYIATEYTWKSIGPDNVAGRTLDLCVNPLNPRTIWAASASGGLWRSWTGGEGPAAWHPVPTGFPVLGISSIAMSPADTATLYIGTGEVYGYQRAWGGLVDRLTRGSYGIGILTSTDAGTTWNMSLDWRTQAQRGVRDVEVDPLDPRTVWAATSEGTYVTRDAGLSWLRVSDVPMAMSLLLDPQRAGTVLVGCGNFGQTGSGIYRTKDGGSTWELCSEGLPTAWSGKITLARAPSDPSVIYASIGGVTEPFVGTALCMSSDRGDTWTVIAQENYADYQGWYSHAALPHAQRSDRVLAVGIDVWRMESSSSPLERMSDWRAGYGGVVEAGESEGEQNFVHADVHCIVRHPSDPETVFFGCDGGVFRSTDFGATFRSLNGGLRTTQFYNGFASVPDARYPALGGLQDNGTVVYEGRDSWSRVLGGDGAMCAVNPGDFLVYASTQYGAHYRSPDIGTSWERILDSDYRAAFVSPLLLCPSDPNVLYAARQKVLRSTDGGDTWTDTNKGAVLDGNPVLVLAGSTRSADTVYAATAPLRSRMKVFATADRGTAWRNVTGGLPDRYPVDIAVHPVDSRMAYLALSGFGTPHVWKTSDAGASWTDVSAGLPDLPFTALLIDPLYPDQVYAGCDLGVFLSKDGGASWRYWSDGLPDAVQAMDLSLVPSERAIRVATHGCGVFERLLEGAVASVDHAVADHSPRITSLAPQPASDRVSVTVSGAGTSVARLLLHDIRGRVCASVELAPGSHPASSYTLDTHTLPEGAYFLTLLSGVHRSTRRVLVLR